MEFKCERNRSMGWNYQNLRSSTQRRLPRDGLRRTTRHGFLSSTFRRLLGGGGGAGCCSALAGKGGHVTSTVQSCRKKPQTKPHHAITFERLHAHEEHHCNQKPVQLSPDACGHCEITRTALGSVTSESKTQQHPSHGLGTAAWPVHQDQVDEVLRTKSAFTNFNVAGRVCCDDFLQCWCRGRIPSRWNPARDVMLMWTCRAFLCRVLSNSSQTPVSQLVHKFFGLGQVGVCDRIPAAALLPHTAKRIVRDGGSATSSSRIDNLKDPIRASELLSDLVNRGLTCGPCP